MGPGLFHFPQVFVGLPDPVGARGRENVEIHGVLHRLGLVRHIGRDAENLARMDYDFLAIDPELERTLNDVRELFVVMRMLGDDASLFQKHARQHNLLPDNELSLQQRVQIFERDGVPGNILQLRRRGGVLSERAFATRVGLTVGARGRVRFRRLSVRRFQFRF